MNKSFNLISKVLYRKVVLNSGVIYCFQLASVGIQTINLNFACTEIRKNQHIMLYWNVYHAPLKMVVFLIVTVLFARQWCAQLFVSANLAEAFQQKQILIEISIKRMPTTMILIMVMRIKHTDRIVVCEHSFNMYFKFSVKVKVLAPWYQWVRNASFTENFGGHLK